MELGSFLAGITYDNAYVLFLDASGYSSIVGKNPRDRAASAFDLLRERVAARVAELAELHRCERATLWSWRGDGGFLLIHDDDESVARDVALTAGRSILTVDLPQLREELAGAEFRGELRIRLSVHKGPIHVPTMAEKGSFHSPDVNFAAHLEEATPPDRLSISGKVHRVAGPFADQFEHVGVLEDHEIYLMRLDEPIESGARAWLRTSGLAGPVRVHAYPHRPSQHEKARLVNVASTEMLDLGTALNTCANLLVTTERPAVYRDAVLTFLRRGGTYRCVLLDPTGEAAALFSRLRGEDLPTKIKGSLAKLGRFKARHGAEADRLEVCQTVEFPGMAALCADPGTPQGLVLYSPYLLGLHPSSSVIERADMPHYFAGAESGQIYRTLSDAIVKATLPEVMRRVM